MKRIVVATDNYFPRIDGIAKYLSDVLPSLPYNFDVIAPAFEGSLHGQRGARIQVQRVALSKLTVGDFIVPKSPPKSMLKTIDKADALWVHTMGPIGNACLQYAARKKIPIIASVHSIDWELVPKSLSKFNILKYIGRSLTLMRARSFYGKTDLIICPDKHVEQLFVKKYLGHTHKTVRLGIDVDNFVPPQNKSAAKEAIGLQPFDKVIGYVGRLSREKGIDTLLASFAKIQEKHNTTLLVIGDGLEEFKTAMNQKNIKYVGSQSNVVPFLQAMDIFVMPSHTETTCLAALEAMSCQVTPVCTPVGAMRSYIKDKRNGLHFPVKNDFVLTLKLDWLLQQTEHRMQMAEEARDTVKELYDQKKTNKELKQILQQFLV